MTWHGYVFYGVTGVFVVLCLTTLIYAAVETVREIRSQKENGKEEGGSS